MKAKPDAPAGRLCTVGYDEHEWVDFVLGKLPETAVHRMQAHLADCSLCDESCRQWRRLLDEGAAPLTAMGSKADESEVYPADRVRQAIAGRVRRLAWKRRLSRSWLAGIATAFAAFMVVALVLGGKGDRAEQPVFDAYVRLQEPAALAVMSAPDTSRYRILSAEPGEREGYFWLSGDSREAFLLLEQLPEREYEDYQAWAVSGSRQDSLGLVKLAEGRGHLYVRGDTLRLAEMIALSAEPKGGSRQPTKEQSILLLLGQR